MASLAQDICDAAQEELVKRAVNSGDGFRQWVYPNLPAKYDINRQAFDEIHQLMLEGHSAIEIVQTLYERHA